MTADSAEEAFSCLGMDSPCVRDVDVDLILMDITMPGMDGIQACRLIKAMPRLRDIPIITVTARSVVR